jgi:hypothetical protein
MLDLKYETKDYIIVRTDEGDNIVPLIEEFEDVSESVTVTSHEGYIFLIFKKKLINKTQRIIKEESICNN